MSTEQSYLYGKSIILPKEPYTHVCVFRKEEEEKITFSCPAPALFPQTFQLTLPTYDLYYKRALAAVQSITDERII